MKKETLAAKRRKLLIAQMCADAILFGSAYFIGNNILEKRKDFDKRIETIEYSVDDNIYEELEDLKQKADKEYSNYLSLVYGITLSGVVLTSYNATKKIDRYDQLLENEKDDEMKLKRSLKQ